MDSLKKVIWSDESECTLFQSDGCVIIREAGEAPIMPGAYRMGQFYDMGLLQLVGSWFGSNCERVVQGAWDIIFTH